MNEVGYLIPTPTTQLARGDDTRPSFPVTLEQTEDGRWYACSTEPSWVGGLGDSEEEAIKDWKRCMQLWLEGVED